MTSATFNQFFFTELSDDMHVILPTAEKDRIAIVDVVRGFAIIGVLIANFISYIEQQTPQSVLDAISSPSDTLSL